MPETPDHSHHDHNHHHDHSVSVTKNNQSRVFVAMLLTLGFMIAEMVGGIWSGSLALIADAGHMLSDAIALMFSWLAFKFSNKQTDSKHSYGWHRLQILAAFTNGISLLFIILWIIIEAGSRLIHPEPIMATPMLIIAVLGLIVNIIVFKVLSGGDRHNLNLKSALLHVLGDLLGSIATILAAVLIWLKGWNWADPILSLLVAVLLTKSAWQVVRKSAHILIEGKPAELDNKTISQNLCLNISQLKQVHHIHIWSLTNQQNIITLHAQIEDLNQTETVLKQIKQQLKQQFNINHSTIQIEQHQCHDPNCPL